MTQPAMFAATKLRRGMILTRIRVGDVKPWAMGEKAMCHLRLSTRLPPLKTTAISWGNYAWEWSVEGLSVLAHTHTPPTD